MQYQCEHSLLGIGRYESFIISSKKPYKSSGDINDFVKDVMGKINTTFAINGDENSNNRRFLYDFYQYFRTDLYDGNACS